MSHHFFEHYALLGLKPGASWRELRSAYRKQVRAWHPDRFEGDANARGRAEERTKAINRAYHELAQYYRQHAALPLTRDNPESPRSANHAPASNPDAPAVDSNFDPQPPPAWPAIVPSVRYGAALLGSIAVILLLLKVLTPRNEPSLALPTDPTPPAATAADHGTSPIPKQSFVTYGSTMGEVYAIQGIPSRTEQNVWHYGASKIYFRDGIVLRWEEDREHPLKTHIDVTASHTPATVFGKGSTKSEVRNIQGHPIRESDKMWDYGVSRVYFQGDRVVDWYESPLDPLKVKH